MRKTLCVAAAVGAVFVSGAVTSVRAQGEEMAGMRFPVGLSYISGFSDVVDYYERTRPVENTGNIPIGLSFTPYYQFEHGSRLGVDIGPAGVIMGDVSYWDVPLGIAYGIAFVPHAPVSPYLRAGIKYHIAGGDDVDSSSPGVFGAFGVEFMRTSRVGIQIELGYDSSEVTFASEDYHYRYGHVYRSDNEEKIKTGAASLSIRAVF